MAQCPDALVEEYLPVLLASGYTPDQVSQYADTEINCIGRNLAWKNEDDFNFDTNKFLWRQIFSLKPEIFFDVWPPIIISILALLQHFDTFKVWSLNVIIHQYPMLLYIHNKTNTVY